MALKGGVQVPNGEKWTVIGVKQHKTGTQRVATVSLDEEEDVWLDVYYRHVRPAFLQNSDDVEEDEILNFHNWKSHLQPFQRPTKVSCQFSKSKTVSDERTRKNKLPNITSQVATQVFETNTKANFTDAEKALVADYLAHTPATADRH
ncbi:unnamed protein product [Coregonus sp. 'balchen']|nr:unnamed protein product [Coregonus sp. 'balchen']